MRSLLEELTEDAWAKEVEDGRVLCSGQSFRSESSGVILLILRRMRQVDRVGWCANAMVWSEGAQIGLSADRESHGRVRLHSVFILKL